MTTKLVPLGNRVLLKKIEASTRGGLRLPQSSEIDEGTQEFEVVGLPSGYGVAYNVETGQAAITIHANGRAIRTVVLSLGDRIYLARHKGWKIETNSGEELYVAEVDDVLAVEVDVEGSEQGGSA